MEELEIADSGGVLTVVNRREAGMGAGMDSVSKYG